MDIYEGLFVIVGKGDEQRSAASALEDMPRAGGEMVAIQRQHPGLWVAVKKGQVVMARDSPDVLYPCLQNRGLSGMTIFRCPGQGETELVGLG